MEYILRIERFIYLFIYIFSKSLVHAIFFLFLFFLKIVFSLEDLFIPLVDLAVILKGLVNLVYLI